MKKIKIVLAVILAVLIVGVAGGFYYQNETQNVWSWDLTNEGCNTETNNITFTQEMFTCAGGSEPEVVLASILDVSEGLTSWSSERWEQGFPNELTNILSDVPCWICVENNCVLTIERC